MSTPALPETVTELEPTNWGDPSGEGLLAKMESFDFDNPNPPAAPPVAEPAKSEPAKSEPTEPAKAAEKPVAAPVEPAKTPETDPVLPEGDFFSKSATEPVEPKKDDAPEFDEKAFDAQTDEAARAMDPKAGAKFKELRAELKDFKQREAAKLVPEDVRREMEDLKLKAAEAEGLKQRISEISSQSAKLAMENEPEYKRLVLDPVARAYAESDRLAEATGVDANILRSLIRERDLAKQEEMLETHFGDKSLLVQAKVGTLVESFNTALLNREALLENAEAKIEAARNQRIEEERRVLAEQHLAVQKHQKKLVDEWKSFIPNMLDETGEMTPAYKKLVDQSLAIDFSTATASDMARAAFFGMVTPQIIKEALLMKKELEAYRKADGKVVETSPKPGDSLAATPAEPQAPKTFMEMAAMDIA